MCQYLVSNSLFLTFYAVKDEEDQIENVAKEQREFKNKRRTYTQGTIKEGQKYERVIKTGRSR